MFRIKLLHITFNVMDDITVNQAYGSHHKGYEAYPNPL
jgi:hypothetical protein